MNSDGLQRQDKLGDLHGKVAFKASICGLGMEKRKHFPSLGCLFFKRRFKAQTICLSIPFKSIHGVSFQGVRTLSCTEEYCSREILANPKDGKSFSIMYVDLIWETQKDGIRTDGYFDR